MAILKEHSDLVSNSAYIMADDRLCKSISERCFLFILSVIDFLFLDLTLHIIESAV